jgi:formylglycine-generating enzyme required for sulfatase activity
MAGNVFEWVHDRYQNHLGSTSVVDPFGASGSIYRVYRGGAYAFESSMERAAWRDVSHPQNGGGVIGLRCARTLLP